MRIADRASAKSGPMGRIERWGWANSEAYYKYSDAEEFWVENNQSVQGCVFVRPLGGQ